MRLNETLGPCTPRNEAKFEGKRFRPTMTWEQYFNEINNLCDELNDMDAALKEVSEALKQPKEKNEPSKR